MKSIILTITLFMVVLFQVQGQQIKNGDTLTENLKQVRLISETNDTTTIAEVFATIEHNIVFIDFWASWCGPCMKQMPHSKKLQKTLEGKPVGFAYFSTDENHNAWLKQKEKLKLTGLNYRLVKADKKLLQQAFKIPGIPFYTTWTNDMKVLNHKSEWPSSGKKLERELLKYLDK